MGTPARFHWYAYRSTAGTHAVETAVSVLPTLAVPEIVGVCAVVNSARAIAVVCALSGDGDE
jgi:hypothetical protein